MFTVVDPWDFHLGGGGVVCMQLFLSIAYPLKWENDSVSAFKFRFFEGIEFVSIAKL